jgi:hypothetical protein
MCLFSFTKFRSTVDGLIGGEKIGGVLIGFDKIFVLFSLFTTGMQPVIQAVLCNLT